MAKRLELWRSCVVSTLIHGLHVMVLSTAQAGRLRPLAIQQARQIAKSYSVITRESNDEFMERYAIKDVVELIAAAFVRFSEKPAADFERLPELDRCRQWQSILRANFVDIAKMHLLLSNLCLLIWWLNSSSVMSVVLPLQHRLP